jgi:hypothetical protein
LWKQDVIDEFWKMEQGATEMLKLPPFATATALGAPPEQRLGTKEKRKESLHQLFISVCEVASNSLSATTTLEKYLKRRLTDLTKEPVGLSVPNPIVYGKNQTQKRLANKGGPGSLRNKQEGHHVGFSN